MIIDAHIHLPVVSEERTYEQAKELLLEDMIRDQVSYAILIPDNLSNSAIGDVPTCLRLVQDTPELFLMGTIDIETQAKGWISALENLIEQKRVVGMKIYPGHDPIYPTDPRLEPVYELCQETGTPLVIHTGINPGQPDVAEYNDPKYIVAVAKRYPVLKIVIAHFYWPEVDYCYEITHSHANIYYDTSGLADGELIAATGYDRIQNVLLKTLESGPKRVIFGTDYAMCNRADHIRMVDHLPVASEVRESIFWRNAVELFKLPLSNC